ncbi:AbrB/MazE/SpoVT family DNA-binding domain-containing protein [Marinibaculum pumilum]|uniref:AbrB/MazE/SpoVT family DNA-binding domain-containing protein n=1 Tax=Marinibaculum pumilum TaxID=1766165 RepID=A0ABV7KWV1_9PROT
MRVTSKGQVTIPQHIREHAGLRPGCEVEFTIDDEGHVRVGLKREQPDNKPLAEAIERLKGSADAGMSTEEIMALTRDWP